MKRRNVFALFGVPAIAVLMPPQRQEQKLFVSGIDPDQMFSGEQLREMMDSIIAHQRGAA